MQELTGSDFKWLQGLMESDFKLIAKINGTRIVMLTEVRFYRHCKGKWDQTLKGLKGLNGSDFKRIE